MKIDPLLLLRPVVVGHMQIMALYSYRFLDMALHTMALLRAVCILGYAMH